MSTTTTMWVWRSDLVETGSVEGFSVEAQDGSIGKIDETTNEVGGSYVVVDTGPWIFGKKVLLPAGMIERVDPTDERVFVALTKEQIKNAPEFDDDHLPRRRIPLVAGRLLRPVPHQVTRVSAEEPPTMVAPPPSSPSQRSVPGRRAPSAPEKGGA